MEGARSAEAARPGRPIEIAATVAVVTASTGIAWVLFGRESLPDVAMLHLLGVVAVAMRFSFFASILAAVLSVLSYDFFFVPPYLSFRVYDARHVLTFVTMFLIGVVVSTLMQRIRDQAAAVHAREERNAELRIEAEAERLQSSLLSSVSHDLRTPLAVITGAASTLLSASPPMDPAARRDLLEVIAEESVRLTRLVGNLLDMTRLAAGAVKVSKEWQSVEGVVGAAIGRVEEVFGGPPVRAEIPADLPLVPFDAVLVEQVLINLLENAAKYAPAGTPVEVRAAATGPSEVTLSVLDRGPGVPLADRSRIFDKFYRVPGERGGGAGLGLAICRGIVEAHGGRIEVGDREGGGAVFRFTLPIDGLLPTVEEDGVLP